MELSLKRDRSVSIVIRLDDPGFYSRQGREMSSDSEGLVSHYCHYND